MADYKTQFQRYRDLVELELERCFHAQTGLPYQLLIDAMKYSLLSGGKRIRSVMTLAFYDLFGGDLNAALPYAAALEMIHAYSLIHDDLPCMDNDDMRRGKPSCHIAFGEANALLAGDGLLTLAFETASKGNGISPERALQAVRLLAQAAGAHGMVAGQIMDLANENKQLTAAELDAINDRKTGALFCASAELGCVLAGAEPSVLDAARQYAQCIGRAFQIVDDLLDTLSDAETVGKSVGSDQDNHKNTYASIYEEEQCRALVAALTQNAKETIGTIDADTDFLAELAEQLKDRVF